MAYATVAQFRQYRGITTDDDDALIATLIDRAQREIEQYCGREFEASADSTRYFDADGEYVDGATLHTSWVGDLCAITTVTNGDSSTVTSGQYTTYPKTLTDREPVIQRLVLLGSGGIAWTYSNDPENAISIAGKWAYSTTPPDDIKHACIRLAAYMYAQMDAAVYDVTAIPGTGEILVPQGMPQDVRLILDQYRRHQWAL